LIEAESQIPKRTIQTYLETIFYIDLDDNYLVDLTIKDEKITNWNTSGRPRIPNAKRSQLRHVTPFCFLEKLLKKESVTFLNIKSIIESLFSNSSGICITKEELNQSSSLKNIFLKHPHILLPTQINRSKGNFYHLITQSSPQYQRITQTIQNEGRLDIEILQNKFKEKNKKYLTSALTVLNESIRDKNTKDLAFEQLVRILAASFNQKKKIAFPTEGNTVNVEIREEEDDQSYYILDQKDLVKKIKEHEDGKGTLKTIRIVNVEGPIIQKTNSNLEELDKSMDQNKNLQSDIDTLSNIATHLYQLFDFKPLEEEVVARVEENLKTGNTYSFFTEVNGTKTKTFALYNGHDYRNYQTRSNSRYTKKVEYRPHKGSESEKTILIERAVEFVLIAKKIYPGFNCQGVSNCFYSLLNEKFGYNLDFTTTETAALAESLSETDPKGITVEGSSLLELLSLL